MSRRVEDKSYALELIGAAARKGAEAANQRINGLTAADIAFDNSGTSLLATSVQAAIEEVEGLPGGGGGGGLSNYQVRSIALRR